MLDGLRSLANSLWAKTLLVFLVLAFGFWGVGDMLRQGGGRVVVATVGPATVSGDEFGRALHRETEIMRARMGDNYSPELMASLNLPRQVLKNLIDRKLIDLEAESLGLEPGDADIVRRIRSNPEFQDSKGNFDKASFEDGLKKTGRSEKAYTDQLRRDIAAGLLVETLVSAAPVSDTAVRTLFAAREEQRAATLYTLGAGLVKDVGAPDEAQAESYYKDHSREFTAPEYRNISYVMLTGADVKNVPVSEEDLQKAYKDRIDEFKHSERRTIEQLLYDSEDNAKKAEESLKQGKSFAQVAQDISPLNKDSLPLGKLERGELPENAAGAVFALHNGEFTQPIQTPFGWNIFHVTAIEPPSVAAFAEVRPQLEKELGASGGDEALSKLAAKVEDALAGGSTLQEAASEMKLKIQTAGPVNRQGDTPDGSKAKDMPPIDKFLDTAFKTEEKGESPMMTDKGGTYYILHIDSVVPERLRTLDEVRGLVAASWQKEEREKRLTGLAADIAGKFKDAGARGTVISQYGLTPVPATLKRTSHAAGSLQLPPEFVTDLFGHKAQESTNAYPMDNGNYVLAVVTDVIEAPSPDSDPKLTAALTGIRETLESNMQQEILEEYTRSLARKYPVSVNIAALPSDKE